MPAESNPVLGQLWREQTYRSVTVRRTGSVACNFCGSRSISRNGYCGRCTACIDCGRLHEACMCTVAGSHPLRSMQVRDVDTVLCTCGSSSISLTGWCEECRRCVFCADIATRCRCSTRSRMRWYRMAQLRESRNEMPQGDRRRAIPPVAFDNVAWCSCCGTETRQDDCTYCEDHDTWSCSACGPCESRDHAYARANSSGINCWNYRPRHYRPKGNWRTADGAEALLGLELEVGGRSGGVIADAVRAFDPQADHLYLKEDGSISGVEIVTHPMTLAYAREYPFADVLAKLRELRCRVDAGYGLHVHVSRNAFRHKGKQSRPHQMLWLMFMYRNSVELEKLARRSSERWATFAKPVKGELKRKAEGLNYNPDNGLSDSRYVAVNCNNERTFELRFFMSTLKDREFYAALEFADASVRYTEGLNSWDVVHGRGLTWPHFTKWVQRHNYRNLYAEIVGEPQPRAKRKPRKSRTAATSVVTDPTAPDGCEQAVEAGVFEAAPRRSYPSGSTARERDALRFINDADLDDAVFGIPADVDARQRQASSSPEYVFRTTPSAGYRWTILGTVDEEDHPTIDGTDDDLGPWWNR